MSVYPAPNEILPIFNSLNYENSDMAITIANADLRYLKLSGGILSGLLTTNAGLNSVGAVSISNTAASTSSSTGALQCAGGAYIGANSLFGPNAQLIVDTANKGTSPWTAPKYSFSGNTNTGIYFADNSTTYKEVGIAIGGAPVFSAGINATLNSFYNNFYNVDGSLTGSFTAATGTGAGYLTLANTAASTSSSTGALQCAGGAYFGANSLFNSNLTLQGTSATLALSGASSKLTLANTTASTSSSTGALQCAGGAYFGANSLFTGVKIGANGTTLNTVKTGSIVLNGVVIGGGAVAPIYTLSISGYSSTPTVVCTIASPAAGTGNWDRTFATVDLANSSSTQIRFNGFNQGGGNTSGTATLNYIIFG